MIEQIGHCLVFLIIKCEFGSKIVTLYHCMIRVQAGIIIGQSRLFSVGPNTVKTCVCFAMKRRLNVLWHCNLFTSGV
ncbi:hypothetical protein GJAV_G00021480 [Gymnothorax javanicus]|nr:hypothetical protein GJAV_G00021480 [Gymnothorax javanicus]